MWHAPLKVNRLQCVDSDRRLLYATNASRIRSSLSGSQLRLQNSACVGRINSACMCVRVCVCVWVCASVSSFLRVCPKLSSHLFMSCEKREKERLFFLEHTRGFSPSASSSLSHEKNKRIDWPNAQGQRSHLKQQKISVRKQGVLWCCAARHVVCKHRSIYNYMCLCGEERHYGPLDVCCHLVLSSYRKELAIGGEWRSCRGGWNTGRGAR